MLPSFCYYADSEQGKVQPFELIIISVSLFSISILLPFIYVLFSLSNSAINHSLIRPGIVKDIKLTGNTVSYE